jgi:hypothetical protein
VHDAFVAGVLDPNSQRNERVARGLDVAAWIQIGDDKRRVAASAGDKRPMGDGFVPGNADVSAQTARMKSHQKESLSIS